MKVTIYSSLTELQRREPQKKEKTVFIKGVVKIVTAVSMLPYNTLRKG